MDFTQHLQVWSKGDIIQGKCMIGIALFIILPICVLLIKSGNPLQRGMIIPLGILFLLNVGYGGYLLFSRTKHLEQTERTSPLNSQTIESEIAKIEADGKSYILTKYFWCSLLILSAIFFFIFTKDYFRGISLGLAIMFFGMLLIDVFLHDRLKLYLTALNEIFS